jgi:hypothetical protein
MNASTFVLFLPFFSFAKLQLHHEHRCELLISATWRKWYRRSAFYAVRKSIGRSADQAVLTGIVFILGADIA